MATTVMYCVYWRSYVGNIGVLSYMGMIFTLTHRTVLYQEHLAQSRGSDLWWGQVSCFFTPVESMEAALPQHSGNPLPPKSLPIPLLYNWNLLG